MWFVGAVCLSACATTESATKLQVPLIARETDLWCWSASAQMCMNYLGDSTSQCTQANDVLSRNDCCSDPKPSACATNYWPHFEQYGFSFKRTTSKALSWQEIKGEIAHQRPIAFSWKYKSNGGGHMMVITGYAETFLKRELLINDPAPTGQGSRYTITYRKYVSGKDYRHWDDFYELEKK